MKTWRDFYAARIRRAYFPAERMTGDMETIKNEYAYTLIKWMIESVRDERHARGLDPRQEGESMLVVSDPEKMHYMLATFEERIRAHDPDP